MWPSQPKSNESNAIILLIPTGVEMAGCAFPAPPLWLSFDLVESWDVGAGLLVADSYQGRGRGMERIRLVGKMYERPGEGSADLVTSEFWFSHRACLKTLIQVDHRTAAWFIRGG